MIINNIQRKHKNKKITVSADVQFKNSKKETIFFTVSEAYQDFLSIDATPFLSAVLLPCMKTREAITVEGQVSEEFLRNTRKIMNLITSWNVGLDAIDIVVSATKKDMYTSLYIGSFFSGGVDSFYTYLKHSKKKKDAITHFLLVHGFDIELTNRSLFTKTEKAVQQIADEEGISLISIKTNLAQIIEPRLVWDFAHGGALAAVGLLLRKQLQQVFISSSVKYDMIFPYGTHPALDTLWSTETMQFTHDGTEYSRIGKIYYSISRSPLALRHLRVCCQNRKGMYNCSRCFKCLGTMITLAAAGVLETSQTFEKHVNLDRVRHMYFPSEFGYHSLAYENIELLKKTHRNPELQKALYESLKRSKRFSLKRKLVRVFSYIDQRYNQRRIYKFVFTMNKQQDRNVIFKFLSAQGFIK